MTASRAGDVLVEIAGPVARATIDRPRTANALSPSVVAGLGMAIDAATIADCSVLVLNGTGGTLSAGADLAYLRRALGDEVELRSFLTTLGATLDRLEAAPFVSIAVVDGYALAGGCEILLACDLAVVSDEAGIGDRHLEYGLLPGAGASVRLTETLPAKLARRLLYSGEIIDGATAARWGLVSHAVPRPELAAAVDALVARLAGHSPTGLARIKLEHRAAAVTDPRTRAAALAEEREMLLDRLIHDPDVAEGLAAFAEHRAPSFAPAPRTGAPAGAPPPTEEDRP